MWVGGVDWADAMEKKNIYIHMYKYKISQVGAPGLNGMILFQHIIVINLANDRHYLPAAARCLLVLL